MGIFELNRAISNVKDDMEKYEKLRLVLKERRRWLEKNKAKVEAEIHEASIQWWDSYNGCTAKQGELKAKLSDLLNQAKNA